MRRLKKVDRNFKASEQFQDKEKVKTERAKEPEVNSCPKCNLNELKSVKKGFRTFNECSCGYKELVK
jgi:hypothetical protein